MGSDDISAATTKIDRLSTDFRELPQESRDAVLIRLAGDPAVREELEDLLEIAVATERASEPARPLQDVLDDGGGRPDPQ